MNVSDVVSARKPSRRFLAWGVWFNVFLTALLLILDLYFHWGQ